VGCGGSAKPTGATRCLGKLPPDLTRAHPGSGATAFTNPCSRPTAPSATTEVNQRGAQHPLAA